MKARNHCSNLQIVDFSKNSTFFCFAFVAPSSLSNANKIYNKYTHYTSFALISFTFLIMNLLTCLNYHIFFSYRVKETPPPPKSKFRLFYLLPATTSQTVIVTIILCINSSQITFLPSSLQIVMWQDVQLLVEKNLLLRLFVYISLIGKYKRVEDKFHYHLSAAVFVYFCSYHILCGY